MLDTSLRDAEMATVQRLCAGGCGVVLHYKLETSCRLYAPDLYCQDGNSAYRGGHLCNDCETAVVEALGVRREGLQRAAQQADGKLRVRRGRKQVRGRR